MSERYYVERTEGWGYVIRDSQQKYVNYGFQPKGAKLETKHRIVASFVQTRELAVRIAALLEARAEEGSGDE